VRQARRYGETELDRAGGQIAGRYPAMTGPRLSAERRRALQLLASSRHGVNEELLVLVRARLAAAEREVVKAGGKAIEVVRIRITKARRQAIEG
jgi:hypothetical protein